MEVSHLDREGIVDSIYVLVRCVTREFFSGNDINYTFCESVETIERVENYSCVGQLTDLEFSRIKLRYDPE